MKKNWRRIIAAGLCVSMLGMTACGKETVWSKPDYPSQNGVEISEAFSEELSDYVALKDEKRYENILAASEKDSYTLELWEQGHLHYKVDHILCAPLENGGAYVIKAYIIDMAMLADIFEIYYFDGSEYTLLETYNGLDFYLYISDGEYLYYCFDGLFYRISKKGAEQLADLTRPLPKDGAEDESDYLIPDRLTSSISAEGDTITISATYYYRTTDEQWSNFSEDITVKKTA